jgi:hypothetical protein
LRRLPLLLCFLFGMAPAALAAPTLSGEVAFGPMGHGLSARGVFESVRDYVISTLRAARVELRTHRPILLEGHSVSREHGRIHVVRPGEPDGPIRDKTTSVWVERFGNGHAAVVRQTWRAVDVTVPPVVVTTRASSDGRMWRSIEIGDQPATKSELGLFLKNRLGRGALGRIEKRPQAPFFKTRDRYRSKGR